MSDLTARTDHCSAPDPLRSVYLRLVAEESIPEEARGQFSYLRPPPCRPGADCAAPAAIPHSDHHLFVAGLRGGGVPP